MRAKRPLTLGPDDIAPEILFEVFEQFIENPEMSFSFCYLQSLSLTAINQFLLIQL